MEKGLVSIITPCYNGESYIGRCLKSIINQTYRPIELIIINDGSTDETEKIIKRYEKILDDNHIILKYYKQSNMGQAAALNRGLKKFEGEFLTWIDSDDELKENAIEKKVDFLKKHLDYDMVRSNGIYVNEATGERQRISNSSNNTKQDIFEDLLLLRTYGCCGCYMVTSSIFNKAFPNKDIYESRCGQNWQVLVPISSQAMCGYIDEDLYIIYEHDDSHSRNKHINNIKRWDDFTDILVESIKVSKCDKEKYFKLVKENCYRQQFYYSISLEDRILMKEKYKDLKKNGHLTFKERALFYKYLWKKSE